MRLTYRTRGLTVSLVHVALMALALGATLGGCMTVNLDTGSIREPVSMTAEVNRDYEVVRHFERPLRTWFTLFDLVTVRDARVEEAIREEMERNRGDGVVNLVIRGQDTFADRAIPVGLSLLGSALISYGSVTYDLLTMGIGTLLTIGSTQVRVRTYTVEGDVIRYRD